MHRPARELPEKNNSGIDVNGIAGPKFDKWMWVKMEDLGDHRC